MLTCNPRMGDVKSAIDNLYIAKSVVGEMSGNYVCIGNGYAECGPS